MNRSDPGVVMVRPFTLDDLEAAADFCDRARAEDPSIEPFAQRLALIATGPRAILPLWQVAEGEDGLLHGIAFAAVREQRASPNVGFGKIAPGTPESFGSQALPGAEAPDPPAPAASRTPMLPLAPLLPGAPPRSGALSRAPRQPYAGAPDLRSLAGARSAAKPPPPLPVAPETRPTIRGPAKPQIPAQEPPGELSSAPMAAVLPPEKPQRTTLELYAAVDVPLRRQGLGRALVERAVHWAQGASEPVALRARVKDAPESRGGLAFLRQLGFQESQAQLTLSWNQAPLDDRSLPALTVRQLLPGDSGGLSQLARLSDAAWAGAPDAFQTRADELAQLMSELGRLVILGSADGRAVGYLSAIWLGKTLGIEEVAVLPEFRRAGVGRALVQFALNKGARSAILSVSEENKSARALYRSMGFTQTARKLILQLNGGPDPT